MTLYLNVPFSEKDEAKVLGAFWDAEKKKWYVKEKQDYYKFQKWILSPDEDECMILCDYFYLVEGLRTCPKCKKQTKVLGFGIKNFIEFFHQDAYDDATPLYYNDEIHIASNLAEILTDKTLEYLKNSYNYYYGYSKFTNSYYYGNHCSHCGTLQGDYYLFSEFDSPFCIDSVEAAKALRLYRIVLAPDIKFYASVHFGSSDDLIKEHAEIVNFKLE